MVILADKKIEATKADLDYEPKSKASKAIIDEAVKKLKFDHTNFSDNQKAQYLTGAIRKARKADEIQDASDIEAVKSNGAGEGGGMGFMGILLIAAVLFFLLKDCDKDDKKNPLDQIAKDCVAAGGFVCAPNQCLGGTLPSITMPRADTVCCKTTCGTTPTCPTPGSCTKNEECANNGKCLNNQCYLTTKEGCDRTGDTGGDSNVARSQPPPGFTECAAGEACVKNFCSTPTTNLACTGEPPQACTVHGSCSSVSQCINGADCVDEKCYTTTTIGCTTRDGDDAPPTDTGRAKDTGFTEKLCPTDKQYFCLKSLQLCALPAANIACTTTAPSCPEPGLCRSSAECHGECLGGKCYKVIKEGCEGSGDNQAAGFSQCPVKNQECLENKCVLPSANRACTTTLPPQDICQVGTCTTKNDCLGTAECFEGKCYTPTSRMGCNRDGDTQGKGFTQCETNEICLKNINTCAVSSGSKSGCSCASLTAGTTGGRCKETQFCLDNKFIRATGDASQSDEGKEISTCCHSQCSDSVDKVVTVDGKKVTIKKTPPQVFKVFAGDDPNALTELPLTPLSGDTYEFTLEDKKYKFAIKNNDRAVFTVEFEAPPNIPLGISLDTLEKKVLLKSAIRLPFATSPGYPFSDFTFEYKVDEGTFQPVIPILTATEKYFEIQNPLSLGLHKVVILQKKGVTQIAQFIIPVNVYDESASPQIVNILSPKEKQVIPRGADITVRFTTNKPLTTEYVDYYWEIGARGATGFTDYRLNNNEYTLNVVLPNNPPVPVTGPNVLHILVKKDTTRLNIISESTVSVVIS